MKRSKPPTVQQRILWKGIAFASGTAATMAVRQAGAAHITGLVLARTD